MKRDYPSLLPGRRKSALPPELQQALRRLGKTLRKAVARPKDVANVVGAMAALPPDNISAIASDIPFCGELYGRPSSWLATILEWIGRDPMRDCLRWTPDLEFLFLFHGNGYLRQAALQKVAGPLDAAFKLTAVLYRLNDWVPQVRQEAMATALRVFETTPSDIILPAIIGVLELRHQWRRGLVEAQVVDEALSRAEVHAAMIRYLMRTASGRSARILVNLLRDNRFDADLVSLMQGSRHPAVRAVALRTLIQQQARWPIGLKTAWTDKSMGRGRRVAEYASRPVASPLSLDTLITRGASDRAAIVRKVAMQGLIDRPAEWPKHLEIIARLAGDRSSAIRQGIAYVQRHLAG